MSNQVKDQQPPLKQNSLQNTYQQQQAEYLYEQIEKEYDLPLQDKSLNSLIMFQFNFKDLKKTIDFLIQNQKKHAFLIQQMINTQSSQSNNKQNDGQNNNMIQPNQLQFLEQIMEKKREEKPKIDYENDKGHGNANDANYEELEKNVQQLQEKQIKDSENIIKQQNSIDNMQKLIDELNKKINDMEKRTDIHENKIFDVQTELENIKLLGELEQVKKQRTLDMERRKSRKGQQIDSDDDLNDDELQDPEDENDTNQALQQEPDYQSQIDELKRLIQEVQLIQNRPTATIRASALDTSNIIPGQSGVSSKELDEMRERLTINEIKINDAEQRLALLLRSKKRGPAKGVSHDNGMEEEQQNTGIDIGEIIALLDDVKKDLRAELASKFEHENLQKNHDMRLVKLEQDANILFEELDKAKMSIHINGERLDGHQNRLNNDSDLITELQNQLRRLTDSVKQKVDGEEIDSMTILVNDMFERFKELENHGGPLSNMKNNTQLNPQAAINRAQTRKSDQEVLERRLSNIGSNGREAKQLRELAETVQLIKERIDKVSNEMSIVSELKIKVQDLFNLNDKKASQSDFSKLQSTVDNCNFEMNKVKTEFEFIRQGQTKFQYDLSDIQDQIRTEVQKINIKMEEIHEKLDELYKVHNEKKAILNIPINFENPGKSKDGKNNGGGFDVSVVVDALEKMRDYIASENKKMREDFFKLHLDIESKLKDKLDKKDIEDLERRLIDNVEMQINERTKKFVDKNDLKKIKAQIDKQIENLFALIQARLSAQNEGENAMLAKKPLGGWSCASCEKNITNLSQQVQEHHHWNRLPFRDPNERMAKVGQGFSKMLQMIRPMDVGQSRMAIDDTNLSLISNPLQQNYQSMPDLKQTATAQQSRQKHLSPQAEFKIGSHQQVKKMASTQITFPNSVIQNGNDSIVENDAMIQVMGPTGIGSSLIERNRSQTQLLPKIAPKTTKPKKIQ